MLAHNIACFSSDLWGLGCIIYQCIVGRPPFKGSSESIVFEEILECNLEIPSDLDPDIESLILGLLTINPLERLGAGPKGSDNDMEALKNHPFFNGYDFKNIHQSVPPISSVLETLEDTMSEKGMDDINLDFENIKL